MTNEQIENLKTFAREIIIDECWDLGGSQSRDGGSVQDLAEKLGLIEPRLATQDDVETCDCEEGERIFQLTGFLKHKEQK